MHYAYVRHLMETRRLPLHTGYGGDHPAQQEISQPPLYYTVAALLTFWAPDQGDYGGLLGRNPHFAYPAPSTVPDNKNMWLHTADEGWPWRGTVLAIRVTRLVSLLFTALGLLAVWGLGCELWPDSPSMPLAADGRLRSAIETDFGSLCRMLLLWLTDEHGLCARWVSVRAGLCRMVLR